jgi:hypothetical protein
MKKKQKVPFFQKPEKKNKSIQINNKENNNNNLIERMNSKLNYYYIITIDFN